MPDNVHPHPHTAMVKATCIGKMNTYAALCETSTDLPADPIGEAVVEALQKCWKAGEDPVNCVVVVTFS